MQSIPAHIIQQIETELKKGNKILAIKIYKEATNVGLFDAKEAIESWESSQKPHFQEMTEYTLLQENRQETIENKDIIEKVYQYLAKNKKLEAIKWVKETKKIGLKEAKEFVDDLEDKPKTQNYAPLAHEMRTENAIPKSEMAEKTVDNPTKGEKITFEFSPIVYEDKKKNKNNTQTQLLFLLILGFLVYMAYKMLPLS